jgi:extracellular elastinolytic metalloproteinase
MVSRRAFARALVAAAVVCLVVASGATSGSTADAKTIALDYIKAQKQALGLTGSDVNDVVVSDVVFSKHNGVTHVYLQQRHKGIEVDNGLINVNVARDGSVISAGNRFVSNLAAAAGSQNANKTAVDAVSAAAGHLELKPKQAFKVVGKKGGPADATTISTGGIAEQPIDAKLVWMPTGNAVRLAWNVRLN